MADKITQIITDALSKAAAHPEGLPLFTGKSDPGLFPNTTAAKPAAQRCLDEGLLRTCGTDGRARTPRELYTLSEAGWEYLLNQVNPKHVLEDFLRVLEARQGEVNELLVAARRMADSLGGLKEAVSRVLPAIETTRLVASGGNASEWLGGQWPHSTGAQDRTIAEAADGRCRPAVSRGDGTDPRQDWSARIVGRLTAWSGAAGEDCPLPELYRSLASASPAPSIGQFHDCLRELVERGVIGLHPWTGPLYALPEPAYALLVGHGIAYYASLRRR